MAAAGVVEDFVGGNASRNFIPSPRDVNCQDSLQQEFDKLRSRKFIYVLLIALNALIILSFFSLSLYENNNLQQKRILMYAMKDIQIKTTSAHLWLEEYLHGDRKEFSKIDLNLNQSLEMIDVLIHGGTIEGFHYSAKNNSTQLEARLVGIRVLIIKLKKAKNVRLEAKDIIASDVIFDLKNDSFLDNLDRFGRDTVEQFKKSYIVYKYIKYMIYLFVVIFVLVGLYLVSLLRKEVHDTTQNLYIDELTKIKNLRAYKKEISFLFKRYDRYKSLFCIIMFDIDNFKDINDTYGHSVGDKVLIGLTEIVKSNIRQGLDKFFRVGGEEFVVLCTDITLNEGIMLSEKLKNNIKKGLRIIEGREITVSVGVTQVKSQDNAESIYKRVDANLYRSKENGKDRVSGD